MYLYLSFQSLVSRQLHGVANFSPLQCMMQLLSGKLWSLSPPLQDDLVAGLDFGELNITSQDDDILDEAAGGGSF